MVPVRIIVPVEDLVMPLEPLITPLKVTVLLNAKVPPDTKAKFLLEVVAAVTLNVAAPEKVTGVPWLPSPLFELISELICKVPALIVVPPV